MNSLREFINQSRATTTPDKRNRADWDEHDMTIALDLRLTGVEAARRIGCSDRTVNKERQEWVFEWRS